MLLLYTFCGENARVLIAEKSGKILCILTEMNEKPRRTADCSAARLNFGVQVRCIHFEGNDIFAALLRGRWVTAFGRAGGMRGIL